jgi:hypothetical protein
MAIKAIIDPTAKNIIRNFAVKNFLKNST